mmetsp:Transcript_34410/g.38681  ORF Transcript_34410/g.38681 Transcript_34410/m.38681 type:complete len:452 (+) Transcript_34410:144-1499(+)
MIVLQPSMRVACKTIQSSSRFDDDVNIDDSKSGSNNSGNNKKQYIIGNEDYFKKEKTVATKNNREAIPPLPLHFSLLQLRLRSYYVHSRRHRYFRRFLLFLWALVVFVLGSALWLAWCGVGLLESLAIATSAPIEICFITAQYASTKEQTDRLVNLREEAPNFFSDERNKSHFHAFAFTNRRDWIAKEEGKFSEKKRQSRIGKTTKEKDDDDGGDNGWTILLTEFSSHTFQRFITQSRYPKFQGFRHEVIQKMCEVVFYMDGTVLPKGSPWKFQQEARRILDSEVQLSQELHPHANEDGGGIAGEMKRCEIKNKDLKTNLQATREWFQTQPDFINDCVLYQNTFFGYATTSPSFRTAADFAWGRFSLEQDSWRDQPLWCYTLHHFGIQPLIIPGNLFEYQGDRRPAHQHTYGLEAATNAHQYYDKNKNNQRINHSDNGNNKDQAEKGEIIK